MNPTRGTRNIMAKTLQSMPDVGIPYGAGAALTGSYSAISIFSANFPDDETSFEIGGVGVNLSILNDKIPDGWTYLSNFTKITIPSGSEMVLIVYGY